MCCDNMRARARSRERLNTLSFHLLSGEAGAVGVELCPAGPARAGWRMERMERTENSRRDEQSSAPGARTASGSVW